MLWAGKTPHSLGHSLNTALSDAVKEEKKDFAPAGSLRRDGEVPSPLNCVPSSSCLTREFHSGKLGSFPHKTLWGQKWWMGWMSLDLFSFGGKEHLSLLELSLSPKHFVPHQSPWGTGDNINQSQTILQHPNPGWNWWRSPAFVSANLTKAAVVQCKALHPPELCLPWLPRLTGLAPEHPFGFEIWAFETWTIPHSCQKMRLAPQRASMLGANLVEIKQALSRGDFVLTTGTFSSINKVKISDNYLGLVTLCLHVPFHLSQLDVDFLVHHLSPKPTKQHLTENLKLHYRDGDFTELCHRFCATRERQGAHNTRKCIQAYITD